VRAGVVYADPPWRFVTRSPKGRGRCPDGPLAHYATMTLEEVFELPVAQEAAPDAALFLWVTDPFLPMGLRLIEAWGFRYSTVAFTWAKTLRSGRDGWHMGTGYWTRSNPEMCLLGVRGRPRRKSRSVRQLIVAPRREHSRKPDETYERIEALVAGPYLELFARTRRDGWTQMGDQAGRWEAGG